MKGTMKTKFDLGEKVETPDGKVWVVKRITIYDQYGIQYFLDAPAEYQSWYGESELKKYYKFKVGDMVKASSGDIGHVVKISSDPTDSGPYIFREMTTSYLVVRREDELELYIEPKPKTESDLRQEIANALVSRFGWANVDGSFVMKFLEDYKITKKTT